MAEHGAQYDHIGSKYDEYTGDLFKAGQWSVGQVR